MQKIRKNWKAHSEILRSKRMDGRTDGRTDGWTKSNSMDISANAGLQNR